MEQPKPKHSAPPPVSPPRQTSTRRNKGKIKTSSTKDEKEARFKQFWQSYATETTPISRPHKKVQSSTETMSESASTLGPTVTQDQTSDVNTELKVKVLPESDQDLKEPESKPDPVTEFLEELKNDDGSRLGIFADIQLHQSDQAEIRVEVAPGVLLRRVYVRFPNRSPFFGLVPNEIKNRDNKDMEEFDELDFDESSSSSVESADGWSVSDSYSTSDDDCCESSVGVEEEDIEDEGGLIVEGALDSNAGIEAFVKSTDPVYHGMVALRPGLLSQQKGRSKVYGSVSYNSMPTSDDESALAPLQPYYF